MQNPTLAEEIAAAIAELQSCLAELTQRTIKLQSLVQSISNQQ